MNGALDEALGRLSATGPEFGGGLSNHGPMVAEAMVRLGHADAITPWLDGYLRRLDDPPAHHTRIDDRNWPEALGDLRRVTDWRDYFQQRLAQAHGATS